MRVVFLAPLAFLARDACAASLHVVDVTTLGQDPQTVNRLNGESFQQDALVTFNGEWPVLDNQACTDVVHRIPVRCVLPERRRERVREASVARAPGSEGRQDVLGILFIHGLQSN